jgi:hypothetical protein
MRKITALAHCKEESRRHCEPISELMTGTLDLPGFEPALAHWAGIAATANKNHKEAAKKSITVRLCAFWLRGGQEQPSSATKKVTGSGGQVSFFLYLMCNNSWDYFTVSFSDFSPTSLPLTLPWNF